MLYTLLKQNFTFFSWWVHWQDRQQNRPIQGKTLRQPTHGFSQIRILSFEQVARKKWNARWNMSKTLFALWLVKIILRDCAKLKYSLTYFLSLFALWLVQIMLVFMPLCQSNPHQMHFSRLIHFLKRKILIFLGGIATFVHFLIGQNYP